MKKEKTLLIIIILLLIAMFSIIGLILFYMNTKEEPKIAAEEVLTEYELNRNLEHVTNRNNYYIVQSCVEKFYTYYTEIFDEEYEGYIADTEAQKAKIKSERIEKVYKMLDSEYIQAEGITIENLTTKLSEVKNTSLIINDMYYAEKDERISAYFVYGIKNGTLKSEPTNFSIMVKLDSKNRTFKIILGQTLENYYNILKKGETIDIKEDEIQNDKYNTYSYEHITENDYINDLLMHYKKSIRFNKENTFNLLDEEYRKRCFENADEYTSYLDLNYSKIVSARIDEYSKEEKEGYTEYIFKDKKGNYFIFKETSPFKYTVLLDEYTIKIGSFEEKYKSLSDKQKVVLNIENFFRSIEEGNYGYSYSVLSTAFKNSKYSTKNDFINYAKQNFFEKNDIEYVSAEKENGLYIYKIILTDATGKSTGEKTFNIIVKLNSGTDFEMSFGQ